MELVRINARDCMERWKNDDPEEFELTAKVYAGGSGEAYWRVKKTLSKSYGFQMTTKNMDSVLSLLWDLSEEKKKSEEKNKK
jgi:hypothetical protein